MIDDILKNRRHVIEFEDEIPDKELVNSLLQRTWKVTPSKNNFMAYTVHVVTDNSTKKLIYNMCTSNEEQVNANSTTQGEYQYILTAPYVLIFTQRLEDKPNKQQQRLIDKGVYYEAVDPNELATMYDVSCIEVGMFAKTLTGLCLENNLDVSYTKCFSQNYKNWIETLPFVNRNPIMIMSIGKGKIYREIKEDDLRPDFERIINWVK
mgnify:FL=1|tara:strand:- start:71 stop:694 length:624 start_codon:yes stop_codon:yes gene_type:complete